ncbi:hypothetical protein GGR50DRAFT_429559 [Xylaria sp. CBS 124048]|nr:hypothetical protein GGR50DRAFT_429559 [Xylaria sp. CBS 124048]
MTRTEKAKATAVAVTVPQAFRPHNALFMLIFALASAYAAWAMRIETAIKGIPVGFVEQVESKVLPDGTPMRTHYTGIEAVDSGLLFLVAAFIAGPLGWDEGVRLQQMHFLVQFFAIVAVWNVEACRARHSWKIVSYTGLFVLLYQTIAGAAIIPLYYLFHTLTSKSDAYFAQGRNVSLPNAKGLLLSVTLGYLVPTLALYIPGLSPSTAQLLTFLWQPSPGFVNLLMFVSSFIFSDTDTDTDTDAASKRVVKTPQDVKHLKRVYAVAGIVCAINHFMTMYVCATSSSNPRLGFAYVFLPNRATWMQSTTAGLHYIFQIDWWGCFLPTLLWCWIAVYDIHRVMGNAGAGAGAGASSIGTAQFVQWAVYIIVLAIVLGPGATLAVVWNWREDRLVMIESGVTKPKST